MTTQPLADRLFNLVSRAQEASEKMGAQYPGDQNAMPCDAIYMMRVMAVKKLCATIQDVVDAYSEKYTSKSEAEIMDLVLTESIIPNQAAIVSAIEFSSTALEIIIRTYKPALTPK